MKNKIQYRPEDVKGPSLLPDTTLPLADSDRGGSRKIALLAMLAAIIVAFSAWWLSRTPEDRVAMRKNAGSVVNEALAETPLAGVGDMLAPGQPPLPANVTSPPTLAGTLSGRQVTGTIAAPMDFGPQAGAAGYAVPVTPQNQPQPGQQTTVESLAGLLGVEAEQPKVTFSQDYAPPAIEDKTLRPAYISGLADWLVSRYRPGNGGSVAITPKALNQECGVNLASQAPGGRAGLLRYAFHPAMISALYNLYIGKFMDDLDEAAIKKGFDDTANRDFHRALAGSAAMLAQAVEGALHVPDMDAQMRELSQLAQKMVDANASLASAVFDLDEAREKGSSNLAAIQSRVESLTQLCRAAEDAHARKRSSLAASIRKYCGPGLDDDSLLYIASWVKRRQAEGRSAVESSAKILRDFSARCARIARES